MNGETTSDYVEVDPTGRYGRYDEVLGKGASKTVYRAFDEYDGIEVAWNQVKLCDFLQTPEDLERLYREIHLLKTLKHKNIMKFCSSWVDTANRNINFVTEMFTSGTLRQYRLKHKRVNIRAVKHWCRQILRGLLYLHSHEPPVIHRDLKCDNIFVNGNQGEVKIGDLGLAAVLRKSYVARCVGTPEFMAPEIYEEEYNELVDIYSFGMCILEMVTFEYPYSECSHPAQIYKKVISGKKPDALYKVKDLEVRCFIEKCLATVSTRLSARELLNDPFLQIDGYGCDSLLRPIDGVPHGPLANGYGKVLDYGPIDNEVSEIDLFSGQEDEHLADDDITIKGRRRDDDDIFLRLRIADKEGRIRNIYFPFDLENDSALSVANEMVSELDITDQDVKKIADMIDGEIATLVPEWKRGTSLEEALDCTDSNVCALNSNLLDYVSPQNPAHLHILQCSHEHGCASIHGRFEEITYQVEGSEQFNGEEDSSDIHYADIWAQRDGPEVVSHEHGEVSCKERHGMSEQPKLRTEFETRNSSSLNHSMSFTDDHENEIRQELRWLKAKYQMQLRELRDRQLGVKTKSVSLHPNPNLAEIDIGKDIASRSLHVADNMSENQTFRDENVVDESSIPELMFTGKSFYTGALVPHSLQRATSLPVDAIDF
ncbi:probable serine/threonine-protein kinase WNK9 [Cucurbita pepo subsp. pepo]|uniref:probable serine/threonine-protein kinase WNK9 n=1 Tax=Cucurbita pepo subsp. pepo TaxID=3664 RepID=UPI000C9D354D|nr:probable serine/threonine-protein kinase WNK9 [Cucurbita pepo subsp. pepo]